MVWDRKVLIEDKSYIVVVSDEMQALLAAQAAGRAVVGVEEMDLTGEGGSPLAASDAGGENREIKGIPFVVPSWEDVTEELLALVLRRHIGLPWLIDKTKRLVIREFVEEDALSIPEQECSGEESIFCSVEKMALYIKNQYAFYEYGTWALVQRETGLLIGMAGVSNPRLPAYMENDLEKLGRYPQGVDTETVKDGSHVRQEAGEGAQEKRLQARSEEDAVWLELGYHIFKPWRGQGYGREAVKAIMSYSHEVLAASLCALISSRNIASCRLAESLGMKAFMNCAYVPEGQGEQILYVEFDCSRQL